MWYIFKEASLMVPFNSSVLPILSVIYDTIMHLIGINYDGSYLIIGISFDGVFSHLVFIPTRLPDFERL